MSSLQLRYALLRINRKLPVVLLLVRVIVIDIRMAPPSAAWGCCTCTSQTQFGGTTLGMQGCGCVGGFGTVGLVYQ